MGKDDGAKIRDLIIHDVSKHLPKAVQPIIPPDKTLEELEGIINESVKMVIDSSAMLHLLEEDMENREKISNIVLQVTKLLLSLKIASEGGELEPHPEEYEGLKTYLKQYYGLE